MSVKREIAVPSHFFSVLGVSHDRMANIGKMRAYLMLSSGFGHAGKQGVIAIDVHRLISGACGLSLLANTHLHPHQAARRAEW